MFRNHSASRPSLRGASIAALALGLTLGLTACETPLERAYGLSQRQHVARTIENPDAGFEDLEARRPDGASTEAALTRYRTGEREGREDQQPSVINVDIGG